MFFQAAASLLISLSTISIANADIELDPAHFVLFSSPDFQKEAIKSLSNGASGEHFGGPYRFRDKDKEWHIGIFKIVPSLLNKVDLDRCFLLHKPAEQLRNYSAQTLSQKVDCKTAEFYRLSAWVTTATSLLGLTLDGKKELQEIAKKNWKAERSFETYKWSQSVSFTFDAGFETFGLKSSIKGNILKKDAPDHTGDANNSISGMKIHEIAERTDDLGQKYYRIWVSTIQTFDPIQERNLAIVHLTQELLKSSSKEEFLKFRTDKEKTKTDNLDSWMQGAGTAAAFQYITLQYAPLQKKLIVRTFNITEDAPTATLVYTEAP